MKRKKVMNKIFNYIVNVWHNRTIVPYIIVFLCIILLLLNNCQKPKVDTQIITQTDTIYTTETIYVKVKEPVEIIRYRDRVFRDTVTIKDTVQVIDIPMERVTYEDSLYKAILSGYKPRLESMEIYTPHTIIETNTEQIITKYRNDYSRHAIGLNIGVSATMDNNKIKLYPAISVGYNLNLIRWRKRK